jgi:hypothetical protein
MPQWTETPDTKTLLDLIIKIYWKMLLYIYSYKSFLICRAI